MNKVFLTGFVTKDLELQETTNGIVYCKVSLAVRRPYQNSENERAVDYFTFKLWQKTAEFYVKYAKKGAQLCVVGSLQNSQYEDKDGNKRNITDIKVSEIEILSFANSPRNKDEEEEESDSNYSERKPKESSNYQQKLEIEEDAELPF